jgi:hypothetical protein
MSRRSFILFQLRDVALWYSFSATERLAMKV